MTDIPTDAKLDAIEGRGQKYRDVRDAATATAASADDVPVLLAAVRQLRYERRLLGFARMTLDLVAAGGPDRREQARREAEDIAQRIVDEIGHTVTDEDALGPSYREQIAALKTAARDLLDALDGVDWSAVGTDISGAYTSLHGLLSGQEATT